MKRFKFAVQYTYQGFGVVMFREDNPLFGEFLSTYPFESMEHAAKRAKARLIKRYRQHLRDKRKLDQEKQAAAPTIEALNRSL